MLAAGTGLAPMVPILQSITDNADDETFVTLVGCFRTFEGIYLKDFLQEQARFWNVRTFFVLSRVSRGGGSIHADGTMTAGHCPGLHGPHRIEVSSAHFQLPGKHFMSWKVQGAGRRP